MVDLAYVKKRKRRKIVAIFGGVGTAGVAAMSVLAFLGRFVGSFTVSVTNGEVALTLSEKASFERTTSMLRIDELAPYGETTFPALPDAEVLDNEDTPYDTGMRKKADGTYVSTDYFKYTFYIKNVGASVSSYNFNVNISENKEADDGSGRTLLDTLRVMIYENTPGTPRVDPVVYAKPAAEVNYLRDGTKTNREFIFDEPFNKTEDDEHPLATNFVSTDRVCTLRTQGFKVGDVKRYTIVTWLEGSDKQSLEDTEPPHGATVKLGVEVGANAG
jgi:hypothetical protein